MRTKGAKNNKARYIVYYSPNHYEEPKMDFFSSINAVSRHLKISRTSIYNHIKKERWDFYSRDCKYYEIIKMDNPYKVESCIS